MQLVEFVLGNETSNVIIIIVIVVTRTSTRMIDPIRLYPIGHDILSGFHDDRPSTKGVEIRHAGGRGKVVAEQDGFAIDLGQLCLGPPSTALQHFEDYCSTTSCSR